MAGHRIMARPMGLLIGLSLMLAACGGASEPLEQQAGPAATATPAVVQEVVVTETPQPAQPTAEADGTFYWLAETPEGRRLNLERSGAAERGFTLVFDDPVNPGKTIFVEGDAIRSLPVEYDDTVTVRGTQGVVDQHEDGRGLSVFWEEQGWLYYVGGAALSRDEAVQIAESLQAVDREAWQQLLAEQAPR